VDKLGRMKEKRVGRGRSGSSSSCRSSTSRSRDRIKHRSKSRDRNRNRSRDRNKRLMNMAHEGSSKKESERWRERNKESGTRRRPLGHQSESQLSAWRLQREEISCVGVKECWAKSPDRIVLYSDHFSCIYASSVCQRYLLTF